MTYQAGQRVLVSSRSHEGHHRTPSYIKGQTGTVERIHGAFTNPETRAYGLDGLPERPLYHVVLENNSGHRIYWDVFEHWLQAAE